MNPKHSFFFPFDLSDPLTETVLRYWFIYPLQEEDGIDYAASGYEKSEKSGRWRPKKPANKDNTFMSAQKLQGRHVVASPLFSFIFSKTFLDRVGDFEMTGENLVEYQIIPIGES